ncbi:uncharacterized protein [Euwallacea fornicatus]|uniref:uncharacterized protein n=1 Tax=Euwallacea fornicatus TaxID=995702 RepID=UPI00338EA5CA
MNLLTVCACLIVGSQGATLSPVHIAEVDVRRSGDQFSYNIKESSGSVAIENSPPGKVGLTLGDKPFQNSLGSGPIPSADPIEERRSNGDDPKPAEAPAAIPIPLGIQPIVLTYAGPNPAMGINIPRDNKKLYSKPLSKEEIPEGVPIYDESKSPLGSLTSQASPIYNDAYVNFQDICYYDRPPNAWTVPKYCVRVLRGMPMSIIN